MSLVRGKMHAALSMQDFSSMFISICWLTGVSLKLLDNQGTELSLELKVQYELTILGENVVVFLCLCKQVVHIFISPAQGSIFCNPCYNVIICK